MAVKSSWYVAMTRVSRFEAGALKLLRESRAIAVHMPGNPKEKPCGQRGVWHRHVYRRESSA